MSVNIISLNQIINLFSNFADRHYFIKDFGYGATSEIGTSRQMDFPYMWLALDENSTIVVQNKTAIPQYGITILFMDKINNQKNYLDINGVNSDNSQEVLSDMLQLLQDMITEIEVEWGNYGLRIDGDVSCFPAVDETTDKVNGWVGRFTLRVKHSNCILPTGDIVQTNISPINPYTRYLTCDTLSTCQVIQDIQTELSGITGGTGNYVPYTGATESVYLGDNSIIMNNGVTDSEMSPSYFAVEISGGSEYSLLEYNQLTMVNNTIPSILSITPSNIIFPNGSIQTTAYTGDTDNYVTGGTYSSGTLTLERQNGSVTITGFTTSNNGTTNLGLFSQTGDSVTITNTPTETSLIGNGIGSLSVPPNGFSIGDSFRVKMGGVISNQNNHTLRIKLKSGSVILLDSGVKTLQSHSTDIWDLVVDFTIRNVGSTGVGSILTLGAFHTTKKNSGNVWGFGFDTLNNTTFDTTISNTLEITLEWGQTSSGDIIYSRTFVLNKVY